MQRNTTPGTWSLGIDIGGSSVKMALVQGDQKQWTLRSEPHEMPTIELLSGSIRSTFEAILKESGIDRGSVSTVTLSVSSDY